MRPSASGGLAVFAEADAVLVDVRLAIDGEDDGAETRRADQ